MSEQTNNPDDERLSAYLDGELDAIEADRLSERLARDPELMRRLEAMRAADAAVRETFRELDETPMPGAVLRMLDGDAGTAPAGAVVAFPARGPRRFLQLPVALAASVALAVGFFVSRQLGEPVPPAASLYAGNVGADTGLYRLLEHGASGRAEDLAGGARGEPVMSFEDRDGAYCRQLRVDRPEGAAHGVACRRNGGWRIEAVVLGDGAAPEGPYRPAAGDVPAALDAYVDGIIDAAGPLGPDEEKEAISRAWKKSAD